MIPDLGKVVDYQIGAVRGAFSSVPMWVGSSMPLPSPWPQAAHPPAASCRALYPAFGDMRLRLIDSLTSEVFRDTNEFDCQYRHLWCCLLGWGHD